MAPDVSAKTKAESVRAVLADDIVAGKLRPGSKLDEIQLATRFKISRTPVREAIKQLHAMGLVEHLPHRGAKVVGVQVVQAVETYGVVLAACIDLAMTRMDAEARQQLEAAADDRAVMEVLIRLLSNPTLGELLLALEGRARPFLGRDLPVRDALMTRRGRKAADMVCEAMADVCRGLSEGTRSQAASAISGFAPSQIMVSAT